MRILAGRTGQLVNYDSAASEIGVSSVTIKRWMSKSLLRKFTDFDTICASSR